MCYAEGKMWFGGFGNVYVMDLRTDEITVLPAHSRWRERKGGREREKKRDKRTAQYFQERASEYVFLSLHDVDFFLAFFFSERK